MADLREAFSEMLAKSVIAQRYTKLEPLGSQAWFTGHHAGGGLSRGPESHREGRRARDGRSRGTVVSDLLAHRNDASTAIGADLV